MRKQSGCGHDHAGLAIAALRHLFGKPGTQNGMITTLGQSFDCRDFLAIRVNDRRRTGRNGSSIEMHHASATLSVPASEFRSLEAEIIAEQPEQRSLSQ
jgi:hypothetical protein